VVSSFAAARRGVRETAADAELFTESFGRAVDSAIGDGIDLRHRFMDPAIAVDSRHVSGLLDWNRAPTPAGVAWTAGRNRPT
jgi:hypothetical protein